MAGRYVVLTFFGSASNPASAEVLKHVTTSLRPLFDDGKLAFFGVSIDPNDEHNERVKEILPGIRHFFDLDRKISEAYGAVDPAQASADGVAFRPFTLVLDPFMRVIANLPLADPGSNGDPDAGEPQSGGAGGSLGAAGGAGAGAGGSSGSSGGGGSRVRVSSTIPDDGARGVLPDAELVFNFSAARALVFRT